jgi:hypothetical protein
MTDSSLRDHLDRLVLDEPPLTMHVAPVLAEGRRLRRRRRAVVATSSAVAVAVVAVGTVAALSAVDGSSKDKLVLTKRVPAAAAPTVSDPGLTPRQQRIADAIRSASPAGWTFDLSPDRWDGAVDVEGTADDGAGAGQLSVGLSVVPGAQQLHPCRDPEFAAGVRCRESTLGNGSVLSIRDVVDDNGIEYTQVALTHPDGTGVIAASGNALVRWPLPAVATADEKRHLTRVNRPTPTYTPDQLAAVAIAVDRATS